MDERVQIINRLELRFRGRLLGYFTPEELSEIRVAITNALAGHHLRFIGIEETISIVGNYFNVSTEAMKGKGRTKTVVMARHSSMSLLRDQGMEWNTIGEIFGHRNYGTAMCGVRSIQERCETDKKFASTMEKLRKMVNHDEQGASSSNGT